VWYDLPDMFFIRILLVLVVVSLPAFSADRKGFVIDPMVIDDTGCIKDVIRANNASGLEKRKQMAELLKFGCVENRHGIYEMTVQETKVVQSANKPVKLYWGLLLVNFDLMKMLDQDITEVKKVYAQGWIFAPEFIEKNIDEMTIYLKSQHK
jgi:hypothetical protein